MGGDGMFAYGLNPIPTNFTDPGVLPMFQETYLYWRVSKGGPGLPEEGGPWDSPMPTWEKLLTDEEMWDAVTYLFEFTGFRPRAQEVHE
jgi:mono/diheme cytochrome c family protein